QEEAFQTIKNNLCDAPILTLPGTVEDLVVYCDASNQGLGCVLMQRGKVIAYASRQLKTYEKNMIWNWELLCLLLRLGGIICMLFSDYECEMIHNHHGKANVVADALSWNERNDTSSQSEELKQENVLMENLHGLDQQMEKKEGESLYFMDRLWVPLVGSMRTMIMDKAHRSKHFVHPGADKMYHDLHDM
ncbi:putative reverse transcriptase domain-containing protein, partial [Tanacetum coccineum]